MTSAPSALKPSATTFIICGDGQVGRTVTEQPKLLKIPFVLFETNDGLYRELINEGYLAIQSDEGYLVIQGDAKRRT